MRKRYFLNLFIFTFAVLIVLCRPFIVYHFYNSSKFPKEPGKIESLLRSLIKKKNEHSPDVEEIAEIKGSRKYQPLLVALLVFVKKTSWLLLSLGLPLLLRRKNVSDLSSICCCCKFTGRFQI